MRLDEKISVDLGPVTVLVGANGSGKSSILKALHWSIRCARLRDGGGKVTLERMDYVPSRDFLELAHKKRIQNRDGFPKICVGFIDENNLETKISLSAARNDAGVKVLIEGPLSHALTSENPQTAYIPGLAGLAEVETVLATPVLRRRAASGEGGSVLRHILLNLVENNDTATDYIELSELGKWVGKVIPGVRFWVKFDRIRDVNIDAQFWTPDMASRGTSIEFQRKPLEMAGTGFLQVVQIFAYLLTFSPRLLLIDEPDAHLHPGTQEALIRAIEQAALEFPDTQFLISTHSPSLVRACGSETKVHWIENGAIKAEDESRVRLRMGWGALDKGLILISEDEKLSLLNGIISQWPELERKVLVWPAFGTGGLPSGDSVAKLSNALGIPIVIHRDRDFMSDNDVEEWKKKKGYSQHAVPVWVTPGSDIESSFIDKGHISRVLDISFEEAGALIDDAIQSIDPRDAEREFNSALQSAVVSIEVENRSIPSERWRELGDYCERTIKGKKLLKSIEVAAKKKLSGTPDARKIGNLVRLRKGSLTNPICCCLKGVLTDVLGRV